MPLLFVWTRTMRLLRRCVFFAGWLGRDTVKCPLAPFAGAAKVMVAPATGFPFLSVTVTASGIGKRVPTVVDWPLAAPAVMLARGGGEVFEGVLA